MSNEAFVTLATNDTYGLGALVLGRSLRRVATSKQTVVLVTTDVSQKMKEELAQVFNLVVTVDTLDSGDAAHLALMSRPELGVTFTKLHAWRLVQFSKCVFLDADTLVVQNCDELFEREELSAAPDPGWPDCFNSGVFVFVPSEATFKALLDFAVAHGSFDGGDQGLLNMFFSDWATGDIRKHLPFIYNVVSSATYSYLPALKYFGSQVKIAHFLGSNKPWLRQSQLGTSSPYQRAWWSIFREDVAGRLSQDMIVARPLAGSSKTPVLLPRYRFRDPWDFVRYENDVSRQHVQHTVGPRSSDRHSQISSTREGGSVNQIVLPPVVNAFQSTTEASSPESPYMTAHKPLPSHIENFGYYHEENNTIQASESQIHPLNNIKSFDMRTEKDNRYSDNTNIKNTKKWDHETKVYSSMENNPTPFNITKCFSKSEVLGEHSQNFSTKTNKHEVIRSDHFPENEPTKINNSKDLNQQYIANTKEWDREIKVFKSMENNPTLNLKKSFSKSEAIGTKRDKIDTPLQNMPTLLTKTNEEDKEIEDRQLIRSDVSEKNKTEKVKPIIIPNTSLKIHSSKKKMYSAADTKLFSSENRMTNLSEVKNRLSTPNKQKIAKIDNDLRNEFSILSIGTETMAMKASASKQTDNTSNKYLDQNKTNYNNQRNSNRLTCDENLIQNNAGVAGVLARGEPDDWRREAWEAGDVDYLGRDSFDNIWKRICECVGITAQTLSAPAAPAATSAGIANQPLVADTKPEEKLPAPITESQPPVAAPEKPTEPAATVEKKTEPAVPVVSAEKTVEPAVTAEKPAEPAVTAGKLAEVAVPVEKPAEPAVTAEKQVEPAATAEKTAEAVVIAEKPAETAVTAEKPVEPAVTAEKPVEPAVTAEKPAEAVVTAEKPAEAAVTAEKPAEAVVTAEKPAEAAVPVEKPAELPVSAEKPVEPAVVTGEKPAEPTISAEKPAETPVSVEKPTEPVVTADKLPETLLAAEKPSETSATSKTKTPEKLPEAAPVSAKSPTVADKEKKPESTPTVEKPSESPKVAETPAQTLPADDKKQEPPSVEKPSESAEKPAAPVPETPTKTTVPEKSEVPAAKSPKDAEPVPAEKKAEAPSPLEKPVEVAPTSEKPAEKSADPTPEPVKPSGPVEAPQICPIKPSAPKPTPPVTPTSSEPSSKSGEARIQPPLVGGEAPVCKKEPGTPTVTPPSGPASPQPADVPPEVCKLQATPSQPATPPASSHQTTDAPVPPKRKQGKNGKSGKGKK